MLAAVNKRVTEILGRTPLKSQSLKGGCVGAVYRVDFSEEDSIVVKSGTAGARLDLEGEMLEYLSLHSNLPVPDVLYSADDLLIISHIDGGNLLTEYSQRHAADLLVDLHSVESERFGFKKDTLIGSLDQPNPWNTSWIEFFRNHRLNYMAEQALMSGRLPENMFYRIRELSDRLDGWITEPAKASLIHGDLWRGNVLSKGDRIAGFIDPAIYYANSEIELAFVTLFNTFNDSFFARYNERRPVSAGFFETRRDIYNLFPLLVHICLFGGSYVKRVETILLRFGY